MPAKLLFNQLVYSSIDSLKKDGHPIIIVAAVKESQAVLNSCRYHGINVVSFCDSIRDKCSQTFCELPVLHTPSLREHYKNARFIIASQHIQDCIEQLVELGYSEFYSPLELLQGYDVSQHEHIVSDSYMEARLRVCINSHEMYRQGASKLYMRSLDVMVTTKCTLRCENCCNLMPYYESHSPFSASSILQAINNLSKNVDLVSEFRLIGGEPFLNKDWANIASGISDAYPDQEIFVYTNGTICPQEDDFARIAGRKVNIIITSYGELSRRLNRLEQLLDKYSLNYVTTPAEHWVDCSSIKHHKRTPERLKEVFKECCVKYLYTLLHGKLYRCPFIANAANLNAIPDNPLNYVNLTGSTRDLRESLGRFINSAKFFPGCDYCDGRPYDATGFKGYDGKGMVVAGVQAKGLLPYKSYATS